jgi:hypothetical protein
MRRLAAWVGLVCILIALPAGGSVEAQEFQIESAYRELFWYLTCSGDMCGPNDEGGWIFEELGEWEAAETYQKGGGGGAASTNATQVSTVDARLLSGTLTAFAQIENHGMGLPNLDPVGSGYTYSSFSVAFTLDAEASYRFMADLETEFLDFGHSPESRAGVSLTGPAGAVFSNELVDQSGRLIVSDVITLPAGVYDLSASVRVRVSDHDEPREGTFINQAAIEFSFIPIPEPSTLLLALLALGVVGGWWKWKHTA